MTGAHNSLNNLNNLNIRCPSCSKLYSVDASEIRTEKPQFECVGCTTRFWFKFPAPAGLIEVPTFLMGQPAAVSQQASPISPVETFTCIKCSYNNPMGSKECASCGLVFEKSRKKDLGIREDVGGTMELKSLWTRVMEDYTNETLHETFIKLALGQKNLPFASQQYRQLLDVNPNEEIALKMREKIINLATVAYVPPKRDFGEKKRVSFPVIIILVGVAFIVSGLVMTALRTVIPVGAFFCAIGGGIIYFNKRQI
jgi:hypothetical protein